MTSHPRSPNDEFKNSPAVTIGGGCSIALTKTMWTKKHAAYSLRQKLPPAAQYLWQWLEETKTLDKPVEPDLRVFNNWVARHRGKGYCRQTVKEAFSKLAECGIVRALKNFGHWAIHPVIVRAINYLMPPKPKPKKKLAPSEFNLRFRPFKPRVRHGQV